MAAMARNTVLLLALVGIVVHLCSVVPPTAAAGRALANVDQLPCPNGGAGGGVNGTFINGGGELNCTTTNLVKGAAFQQGNEQKLHVEAGNITLIDNNNNK